MRASILAGTEAYHAFVRGFLADQFPPPAELPGWVRDALGEAGVPLGR